MSIDVRHDSRSELYRTPAGAVPAGSSVRIRLWTSRPFGQVILRVWMDSERQLPMRELGIYAGGILYEAELATPRQSGLCWYCFLLKDGARDYWYGNAADHLGGVGRVYDVQPPSYQITLYEPSYMPPDWLRAGAMYQIFPDRFFRTDIGPEGSLPTPAAADGVGFRNVNAVNHANWYETPLMEAAANGDNAARDFFGGTLRGITEKLGYLEKLGITVIYLNPIFLSPSNHRYNCADYLRIDPRLGTEADLRELCRQARARGMRIMLDGVFSHTGDDSVYFNRYATFKGMGACQGRSSPYYDWYTFKAFPNEYSCWWGFDTLPEVNENAPTFRRFICGGDAAAQADASACPEGVLRHYLRLGVSGWRLDVADELPMDFIAALRRAAHAEKRDAALLGEVWEDASNKEAYGQVRCYFKGDTVDSVMNYPLRAMAIEFMLGRIKGGEFARRYMALAENYPKPAFYALMNLMGSHDRPRIMNIMAGMDMNMPRAQQASAAIPAHVRALAAKRVTALWRFICALPGIPCIYYGDEAGAHGMGDPFNRGTYPWGREDTVIMREFRTALSVRRASEALRRGDIELYAPCDDVIVAVRKLREGCDYAGVPSHAETFTAILNRARSAVKLCIAAEKLPPMPELKLVDDMCVIELPALTTSYFYNEGGP